MKNLTVPKRIATLGLPAVLAPVEGRALNVSLVYQDATTHEWAREVTERAQKISGPDSLRATWWNMGDFREPGVLAGAVSTAMRADVVVIAMDAAQGLPYPLCVWAESWLPHRMPPTGALMALIGSSTSTPVEANKVREYLGAVAKAGHMELVIEEHRLIPIRTGAIPELLDEPLVRLNGNTRRRPFSRLAPVSSH